MESEPQEETPSLQSHVDSVSVAAKALVDKNIPVVEYGQQIQWRHGDPLVLFVRDKEKKKVFLLSITNL